MPSLIRVTQPISGPYGAMYRLMIRRLMHRRKNSPNAPLAAIYNSAYYIRVGTYRTAMEYARHTRGGYNAFLEARMYREFTWQERRAYE